MKALLLSHRPRAVLFAAGIGCLALATHAPAVMILPGDTAALSGTTAIANPDLAAVVLLDPLIPFQISDASGNVFLTGNYQDRASRSANLGTMIFAPRVRDLSEPAGDAWITGVRIVSFAGVFTNIDFRSDGAGSVGASQVARSSGTGDVLDFSYASGSLSAPADGHTMSILTDALSSANTGTVTIFARKASDPTIFSTVLLNTNAPVPEPSVALFGIALTAAALLQRKRAQAGSLTGSSSGGR